MNVIDALLGMGNYLILNKPLARKIGNDATILLMRYVDLNNYYNGVFYQTRAQLEEATNIGERKQIKIDNKLKTLGFISIRLEGLPPKNNYTIHNDVIIQYIQDLKDPNKQRGKSDSNNEGDERSQSRRKCGVNPSENARQEKEHKEQRTELSKESLTPEKTTQAEKIKLKRRKKPSEPPLAESKATKLRKRSKELKPEPDQSPPLYIPERTMEAINYWINSPFLPNLVINRENPTKVLKQTVKVLGQFFSGKLFKIHGASNLRTNVDKEDLDDLCSCTTLDDFKEFVDIWSEVLTSGKYKVNPVFLGKIGLCEFLAGNTFVKNNNGGLYSPLVDYCFFSPPLKVEDEFPSLTNRLSEVWERLIGPIDPEQKEDLILATKALHSLFEEWSKTNKFSPSVVPYPDVIRLGMAVLAENDDYLKEIGAKPNIMLGGWFKKHAMRVRG